MVLFIYIIFILYYTSYSTPGWAVILPQGPRWVVDLDKRANQVVTEIDPQ